MPALHNIDTNGKLIHTSWYGIAVDSELIDALARYQKDIKSLPQYLYYDEILDFSNTSAFKLTAEGLRRLVEIAVKTDSQRVKTRLAIIVTSTVAYGLARMYQTYRSLVPSASKEVRIFKNYGDALMWIENSPVNGEK
jgi:hypothetical protein